MGSPRSSAKVLRGMRAVLATLLCGCGSAGSQPRTTPAPALEVVDPAAPRSEQLAGQTSVVLRVTRDPAAKAGARMHVVAVVRDRDGVEHVTDLGVYPGTLRERLPEGGEVIAVDIEDGDDICALRLTPRGDYIEARRTAPGQTAEQGEVISRIPVPADVPVLACEPAVETGPNP